MVKYTYLLIYFVLELDFHVQFHWIFEEMLKKNLKYGQSMVSDAIAFNFLKKLDSRLFHVGFEEISFLKSHDVINSNSWFLAILKEFSCLLVLISLVLKLTCINFAQYMEKFDM